MLQASTCKLGRQLRGVERDHVETVKGFTSAKYDEGSSFFSMDEKGLPVSGFDAVVDLYAEVDAGDWAILRLNPYAETYIDVQTFKVKSSTITNTFFQSRKNENSRPEHTFLSSMHGKRSSTV